MIDLNATTPIQRVKPGKETILQFGGGAFLRAFFDYMVDNSNKAGLTDNGIIVLQSHDIKKMQAMQQQDCTYTVCLRGLENGKVVDSCSIIDAITRTMNPSTDFQAFLATATGADIQIIVSNTTESGIVYRQCAFDETNNMTYPAMLTRWLYERFTTADKKGVKILPCELTEDNAALLLRFVLHHAADWQLPQSFISWLNSECVFANTLVDRIVTGLPADASSFYDRLGYRDALLDVAEPYLSFVIEKADEIEEILKFKQAGFSVTYTQDLRLYRQRKVLILNGIHTLSAPLAYLGGIDIVRDAMKNPAIASFVKQTVEHYIFPTMEDEVSALRDFAGKVMERFANPFIDHKWLDISLNAMSKWRVRIMPSAAAYEERTGKVASPMILSLAAWLLFFRCSETDQGYIAQRPDGSTYTVREDAAVLQAFAEAWSAYDNDGDVMTLTERLLTNPVIWGEDAATVSRWLPQTASALKKLLTGSVLEVMGEGMDYGEC